MIPDYALVERMAAADPVALAELRARHGTTAYALAYSLVFNAVDAEHVVGEAFLEAWRSAGRFDRQHETVPAWISAITRNRARDLITARVPRVADTIGTNSRRRKTHVQ
ncbi:MAG: RNA polymerase sigma factor [Gemmatimonadales bacterium]